MLTLRTHGTIIFGGMNGKLLQKITSLKTQRKHVNHTTAAVSPLIECRFFLKVIKNILTQNDTKTTESYR